MGPSYIDVSQFSSLLSQKPQSLDQLEIWLFDQSRLWLVSQNVSPPALQAGRYHEYRECLINVKRGGEKQERRRMPPLLLVISTSGNGTLWSLPNSWSQYLTSLEILHRNGSSPIHLLCLSYLQASSFVYHFFKGDIFKSYNPSLFVSLFNYFSPPPPHAQLM